jgi:hypothetical protein
LFGVIGGGRSIRRDDGALDYDFGVGGRSYGLTVNYDASSGTYTFINNIGETTEGPFTPADQTSSGYFDIYTYQGTLTLFNNVRADASQTGAPVKLTYLTFANYRYDDPIDYNGAGQHISTYFLFGYPTETSDMPTSGTATYSTAVFGDIITQIDGDPATNFTGSATFTADFGSGTVNTMLTLPIAYPGSASSTYSGTGPIDGNEFAGQFTSSTDPYFSKGDFAGGFFGPRAQEMGYVFDIFRYNNTSPDPLSFVAGVVVGTKSP